MKATGSSPTGDARRRTAAFRLAPLLLVSLAARTEASDGWLERLMSNDISVSGFLKHPDPTTRYAATVWVVDEAEPGLAGFGGHLESFAFLPVREGHGSPCDVEAFTGRDGVLFVPLLADARPLGKQMAGLAWDPRARRVAASATGLGAVPETAVVEPLAGGFAFREEPQPSDSANCSPPHDTACGTFRGRPVRSYTEGILPVVWEVSRVPGKGGFAKRLDLARTFEEAPVRKLFESRDAFARAFGLDPGHAFVEAPFYGRLVLADGESWLCAAPARERTGDAMRCRRDGAGKP